MFLSITPSISKLQKESKDTVKCLSKYDQAGILAGFLFSRHQIGAKERGNRNRGFAIVVFKKVEAATRAIEEQEVTIGMASLTIKVAYQSQQRTGNRDAADRQAFQQL